MKEWLARDCPESVVYDQINKVVLGKNHPGKKNSENGIAFAVASHPKVKSIWKLIKDYFRFLRWRRSSESFFISSSGFIKSWKKNKGEM